MEGRKFRVLVEYKPQSKRSKHLAIEYGDVVELVQDLGGGNFKARLGGKEGRVHKDMLEPEPLEPDTPQAVLDQDLPELPAETAEIASQRQKIEDLRSTLQMRENDT